MKELFKLISYDMVKINENLKQEYYKRNLKFLNGTMSDFLTEAKIYAMGYITVSCMKNRTIEIHYMIDNKMELN